MNPRRALHRQLHREPDRRDVARQQHDPRLRSTWPRNPARWRCRRTAATWWSPTSVMPPLPALRPTRSDGDRSDQPAASRLSRSAAHRSASPSGSTALALVATSTDFLLLDPASGDHRRTGHARGRGRQDASRSRRPTFRPISPPPRWQPPRTDCQIYGLGGSTSTVTFRYDVNAKAIFPGGIVTSTGILGPRVVSLNQDGSLAMAGWVMVNEQGTFVNYFPQHTNQFSVGTTAFDDSRGLLYAQIPQTQGEAPTLQVVDSSNLTLHERLQPARESHRQECAFERLQHAVCDFRQRRHGPAGGQPRPGAPGEGASRKTWSSAAVSVTRVSPPSKSRSSDPGGNNTPFSISSDTAGVTVSPT